MKIVFYETEVEPVKIHPGTRIEFVDVGERIEVTTDANGSKEVFATNEIDYIQV